MGPRRTALTLIELLASLVLSVLLLSGLVSLLGSTAREAVQLRQAESTAFPGVILGDLIRQDFRNARGLLADGQGILLHGFLERDPITSTPLWIEGSVRYEVASIAGRRLLVRRSSGPGGTSTEPLWFGCGQLLVESLVQQNLEPDVLPEAGPSPSTPVATGGLPAAPDVFQVTLTDARDVVVWQEVIQHAP